MFKDAERWRERQWHSVPSLTFENGPAVKCIAAKKTSICRQLRTNVQPFENGWSACVLKTETLGGGHQHFARQRWGGEREYKRYT